MTKAFKVSDSATNQNVKNPPNFTQIPNFAHWCIMTQTSVAPLIIVVSYRLHGTYRLFRDGEWNFVSSAPLINWKGP